MNETIAPLNKIKRGGVLLLEKLDYRVRKVNTQNKEYTESALTIITEEVDSLEKGEAAIFKDSIIVIVNNDLKECTYVTTNTPKKRKIDYTKQLNRRNEQEILTELKKTHKLSQGNLNKITKKFNKFVKEMDKNLGELETGLREKYKTVEQYREVILKGITEEIVFESQVNNWLKCFNKHCEEIIQLLSEENKALVPKEIQKQVLNKYQTMDTFFEDFFSNSSSS